jgi:hypothetical protein
VRGQRACIVLHHRQRRTGLGRDLWVPKIMSSASDLGFLLRTGFGEQQPR